MRWVILSMLLNNCFVWSTKNIIPSYDMGNTCRFASDLYENIYIPLGISYLEWENGGQCGICYELHSDEGNFHGIITSLCPDCGKNEISLPPNQEWPFITKAYEIPCPHWKNEKPKYRTLFQEHKLKIQIVDTERPVTSVMLTSNPDVIFQKTWDNFWMIKENIPMNFPFDITCITATGRITHVKIEDTETYKTIDNSQKI